MPFCWQNCAIEKRLRTPYKRREVAQISDFLTKVGTLSACAITNKDRESLRVGTEANPTDYKLSERNILKCNTVRFTISEVKENRTEKTDNLDPRDHPQWKLAEINRLRAKLKNPAEVYNRAGVLYWKSNDHPVPASVFKDAFLVASPAQVKAEGLATEAFLNDYRKVMADHEPSGEELYEMRAAFGAGETVVNVITGKVTKL